MDKLAYGFETPLRKDVSVRGHCTIELLRLKFEAMSQILQRHAHV